MDIIPEKLTSPPLAPLALRVGIVGHRPNRLTRANIPYLTELTPLLTT